MQAYHQTFNTQAYNNGAAAAVAAAYYNQHHNPGNYVLPSQYSMSEGFNYNSSGLSGSGGTGSSSNPNYGSQQGNTALDAYAAAYYPHHGLSGASNLPGINTNLYPSNHASQGGYNSATGMSSSGLNVSNSQDLLTSSSYPYANSFLNVVHHLHQQTMPGSPTHNTTTSNNTENNSNGNEPSSSSSSSLSSSNSLMPVNSSTPNLAQSSVAVAAAAAAAAAALQHQNLYGNSQTYHINSAAAISLNESHYSNNPSIPTSPLSPKSNSKLKVLRGVSTVFKLNLKLFLLNRKR